MTRTIVAGLAGTCILFNSGILAAEHPSYDCSKAATSTEKAICADGRLARLDRAIASGYRQLKNELATFTDELDDEQKAFLANRDECGADRICLTKAMERRRAALALEPDKDDARGAFIGRYQNDLGWMIIRKTLTGTYELSGQTEDPGARWTCDVGGELGAARGGNSIVDAGEDNDPRPITLRMTGKALTITEDENRRLSEHTCGYRGTVEGTYRRVKKLRD